MLTLVRRHLRRNYPNFWKLILDEFRKYKGQRQSTLELFMQEVGVCTLHVIVPTLVGLACHFFGFIPFAPSWLSTIFMVHYMTRQLNKHECNEPVVSPRFLARWIADLLFGLMAVYFHSKPIYPDHSLELTSYIAAWMELISSCLTTASEDFGFYRLYLSLMRAIAVQYRMMYPNEPVFGTGEKDKCSEKADFTNAFKNQEEFKKQN